MLTLAEFEFCELVALDGFHPTRAVGFAMVWLFLLDVQFPRAELLHPGLTLLVLGSLAWQLFRRQSSPVADWALTVVGGLYLGLCGAYLLELRVLEPDGLWWTLTVVSSILLADSGAYFVGRAWGRHKLAPLLSPHKTWEGYIAGVVVGGLTTSMLALLWQLVAGAER